MFDSSHRTLFSSGKECVTVSLQSFDVEKIPRVNNSMFVPVVDMPQSGSNHTSALGGVIFLLSKKKRLSSLQSSNASTLLNHANV